MVLNWKNKIGIFLGILKKGMVNILVLVVVIRNNILIMVKLKVNKEKDK